MSTFDIEKLINNLPEHSGVLGKENYLNSAVLICLVKLNNSYHFLFEKRSANIRQGGEICFPGGQYDPLVDKSYKNTAVRETKEELGIPENKINVLGQLDVFVGPMGITVDPFIGTIEVDSLGALKIDKNEVEKVFAIPLSYFISNPPEEYKVNLMVHPWYTDKNGKRIELLPVSELGLPPRYSTPWGGRNHRILAWKTSEGTIWGITAELIQEIIRLLG